MKTKWNLRTMVSTAMLAAVAGVLMSLEISVPLMPPFYKLDFSDVPSVIAIFAFGPSSGIAVGVIKILIKLITVGTNSAYVGEFGDLVGMLLFVLPIWFVFKKMRYSAKGARAALLISIPIRIAFACFMNACVTLPLYAKAMQLPLDNVIQMVASVNPAITNLTTFIVLATIPFNLIKMGINSLLGYILYDRLSKVHVFERRFVQQ